jgi:hypothetical protein
MNVGDYIAKRNELDAFCEQEDNAHNDRMKPYRDAVKAIEAHLLSELVAQGVQNFKTEHGTAYKVNSMSVSVADRAAFLAFITEQQKWDMLDARALKGPVKEYVETVGYEPPGLKVEFNTKCNIRRS